MRGSKLNEIGWVRQLREFGVPGRIFFINFLAFIFLFTGLFAQNTTFTKGYQVEQRGGIVLVSNNILSCSDCDDVNQMPPGGFTDNNTRFGQYVNVYPEAGIFSSSSANLILPECSEITFAGLYWGGYLTQWNSRYDTRNNVKLKLPGAADYIDITAQMSFKPYDNNYQNFADITSFVTANGSVNGTFTLANVVANTDNINLEAGWTIVIVYKNEFKPLRNLTVFHGLDGITHGNTGELNISISGFRTPPTGPVSFELGFVAYEGDRVRNGDYLKFNNQFIADAVRSQNNVLNSSITYNGSVVTDRNPAHNNTLGYDAGIIIPDNSAMVGGGNRYIQNNATQASIKVATNDDSYAIGVITTAIDIYNPHFAFTHSYVNLSSPGAPLQSKEKIRFEYELKNIGNDQSENTMFSTQLPPLLTDVSDLQIQYNNDGIWHAFTSDMDGDEAEFINATHQLNFRVGSGAGPVAGGVITPDASLRIRFDAMLTSDCELLRCSGGNFINFGTVDYDGNVNSDAHFNQQSGPLPVAGECSASGVMKVDIQLPAECTVPMPDKNFTIACNTNVAAFSLPEGYKLFAAADISFGMPLNEVSAAGTYIARRVIANGCEYRFNVLISLTPITASLLKVRDILCSGSATGSLTLNVNEFSGQYNQQWLKNGSPIITPLNLDSLPAGEYQVLISNSCQQVLTDKVNILEPDSLIVQLISQKNVDCFGAATGVVSVQASGGTAGYTYLLNIISNTTGDFSGLSSGEYTLTVTDAGGCMKTLPVSIREPVAALSIEVAKTDVTCYGEANGEVSVKVSGGAGEYMFSLDNTTNSTGVFTGLLAGDHTVTVTDANGCVTAQEVVISQPSAVLKVEVISKTDVLCFGESDGTVSIQASGGVPDYNYTLNDVINTTGVFTGLPAGDHTITITDAKGCVATQVVVITQPSAALNAEVISKTNISCFGGSGGSVSIQASGGIPGYTYRLNDISNNTGLFAGLSAGDYTITVVDANNCITTKSVSIIQPVLALGTELINQTNVSCFGETNGSFTIQASGGTSGYLYSLKGNSNTTGVFQGLTSGDYSVEVTDAAGCMVTRSITITQPSAALSVSHTIVDVTCFGAADGSVRLVVSGGTAPYKYLWSDGKDTKDRSALVAGTYTLIITDAAGCQISETLKVNQPDSALSLSYSRTDVRCFGENTGAIDITVAGGTAPYTYVWSDGRKLEDLNNLAAGFYSIEVRDARGCSVSATVQVTQPAEPLKVAFNVENALCDGTSGGITASVSGGLQPYKIAWEGLSDTTVVVSGLSVGSYKIIITDASGCAISATVAVTAGNCPPEAVDDQYETGQEIPVTGDVSLNDFDPRDKLVFSMSSFVKYGEIQFFKDGKFIYTPNAGFTGIETFTYEACNTSGLCATATVTIQVTPFTVVSLTPEISNVREGKKGTIKARLLRPFERDVIITLSYSGKAHKEKDYVLLDQYLQILIPKGSLSSTEKITVAALTDNQEEGDEDVVIQIVSSSDPMVRIGNGATIIINDIYPPDVLPLTPVKRDIPENPNLTADPLVSPNQDGLGNEFFKIDNIISFPDNEVMIFNRWGNEVFRIKGYNESDRVFKGFANTGLATSNSPLPDGVYYFLITTNRVSGGQTISNLNKGYLILKR